MIPIRLWFHIGAITATIFFAVALKKGIFFPISPSNSLNTPEKPVIVSKIISQTDVISKPPIEIDDWHQREKERLFERLRRPNDTFPTHHARYRLLSALHGFYRYEYSFTQDIGTIRKMYGYVGQSQKDLVESVVGYEKKMERTEELIKANDKVAQGIFDYALDFYNVEFSEFKKFAEDVEAEGRSADRTSVSQALKHYVRDWSREGEHERSPNFPQILETLQKLYPNRNESEPLRVLLPGSGLGRLAHDVAGLKGFQVTSNEWSTYMNLAYRYVTSPGVSSPKSKTIYPFVDWWSHQPTTAELHRAVSFPDVPVDTSNVLLVEGDFTTVFDQPSDQHGYDVIVTLFFIDTARNILTYLETIHRLLKPGGVWINLGPLLWGSAPFLQLSLDEILDLSEAIGFEFKETDPSYGDISLPGRTVRQKESPYGFNENSLSKNAYWAQFWVTVRK